MKKDYQQLGQSIDEATLKSKLRELQQKVFNNQSGRNLPSLNMQSLPTLEHDEHAR
jgi:hypothetical protein